MNIFYLDHDPVTCAQMHCDQHVIKMCTEYGQLLSTAHRIVDGVLYYDIGKAGQKIKRWRLPDDRDAHLYKASHVNHPSNIWARTNKQNYEWLLNLYIELCNEYTHRYGKFHGAGALTPYLHRFPDRLPEGQFTEPPPAMKQYPECIVEGKSTLSYHNYYRNVKSKFATWTVRSTPSFMLSCA